MNTASTWTGIGAALLLAATATGFAVAAGATHAPPQAAGEPPPPPEPGHGPGRGHGMMPGFFPPMMMAHLAERLDLGAEQKAAIHKALDEARPGFEALHQQMRSDLERLTRTRPDDPAYQTLVASASQAASQTAAQLVLQTSQLRSQVFGVLTAPQRDELVKLEAEHAEHMRDGHAGGMRHGDDDAHHPPGHVPPPPAPPAPPKSR
jgi:Spy/CpxP family protein refolding chaperone